jgi:uncharacterized membrane protein YfcA
VLTVVFLMLAAFTAGLVDAIAGGGGLVTVPALLATGAGMLPAVALATNKGQSTFGAISSAVAFWRRDGVDRERAPYGFVAAFVGALAGARLVLAVRPEPLRPIVVGLLIFAAAVVAMPRRFRPRFGPLKRPRLTLVVAAFLLGVYDGFFGPGVGTLLIVMFVTVFGDTMTRASGNAKVVNLASNLASLGMFVWRGTVLWKLAIPMAIANTVGAAVGARLALKRGDRLVTGAVLLVVAAVVVKLALEMTH